MYLVSHQQYNKLIFFNYLFIVSQLSNFSCIHVIFLDGDYILPHSSHLNPCDFALCDQMYYSISRCVIFIIIVIAPTILRRFRYGAYTRETK